VGDALQPEHVTEKVMSDKIGRKKPREQFVARIKPRILSRIERSIALHAAYRSKRASQVISCLSIVLMRSSCNARRVVPYRLNEELNMVFEDRWSLIRTLTTRSVNLDRN